MLIFLILTRLVLFFLPFVNQNWSWNRWDGPHYLYLAQNGYTNVGDEANFIVFLPAFPLMVRAGLFIFNNPEIVAGALSAIIFLLACFIFYQFSSAKAVLLLAIFPTSYFFSAPYTESLFLLFASLVFFFSLKKRWFAAGLAAGFLTLTRPFGFLAASVIAIEWLQSKEKRFSNLLQAILPTLLALVSYLYLNKLVYSNYFAFQEILHTHWYKTFQFPWKGIAGSLTREDLMTGPVEGITSIVAWVLVPIAFIKKLKIRVSFSVYYLLGVIMFTSTGFILSAPRYLLSLPPFFLILTKIMQNKVLFTAWSVASLVGFIYLTHLFLAGQWAF